MYQSVCSVVDRNMHGRFYGKPRAGSTPGQEEVAAWGEILDRFTRAMRVGISKRLYGVDIYSLSGCSRSFVSSWAATTLQDSSPKRVRLEVATPFRLPQAA